VPDDEPAAAQPFCGGEIHGKDHHQWMSQVSESFNFKIMGSKHGSSRLPLEQNHKKLKWDH